MVMPIEQQRAMQQQQMMSSGLRQPNAGAAKYGAAPQVPQAGGGQPPPQSGMPSLSQAQMAALQKMSPEEREAAIKNLTQDYAGKRQTLGGQMSDAQKTLGAKAPEGTHIGGKSGNYVAANPLEHLASGINKYKARGEYDDALSARKELDDQYGNGVASRLRAGVDAYK